MNDFELINGKRVYYNKDNKPFVLNKDTSSSNGLHKRYGEIKICKECGQKFFTHRKSDYCCNICSGRYVEVIDTIIVNNKLIYITSNEDYFIYELENNKNRRRYGTLKNCKYCNKLFFSENDINIFCSKSCMNSGENSPTYKHGETDLKHSIRTCCKYKEWRNTVFERDEQKCVFCGDTKALDVHHIKSVKDIFEENEVQDMIDINNCEELWDIDNGITVCRDCHYKLHKGELTW